MRLMSRIRKIEELEDDIEETGNIFRRCRMTLEERDEFVKKFCSEYSPPEIEKTKICSQEQNNSQEILFSIDAFEEALIHNPHLTITTSFPEQKRHALAFISISQRKRNNDLPAVGNNRLFHHLSEEYKIHPRRIKFWYLGICQPRLLKNLQTHEQARLAENIEINATSMDPSLLRNLTTEEISELFLSFCKSNHMITIVALDKNVSIETSRKDIEKMMNDKITSCNSSQSLRFGKIGVNLYFWNRTSTPNDWTCIHAHDLFYFTHEFKSKLIAEAARRLGIVGTKESSIYRMNELITQLTNTTYLKYSPSKDRIQLNKRHLSGETLNLLLDAVGLNFDDIKQAVVKITGRNGRKGITKPTFMNGEKLDVARAQIISIVASDGAMTRDGRIFYSEPRFERVERVLGIVRLFGDVHVRIKKRTDGLTYLHFASPLAHAVEYWGWPRGDKTILNSDLPAVIRYASPRAKAAFLSELIVEDGQFDFQTSAHFYWFRSVALHAGNKSSVYGFIPRVSSEDIRFICEHSIKKHIWSDHTKSLVFELSFKILNELRKSDDSLESQHASNLIRIIKENESNLLEGERRIAKDIGISTQREPIHIRYYIDSGRVSVKWRARTQRVKDTELWAKLALPNDVIKAKKVVKWLSRRGITQMNIS